MNKRFKIKNLIEKNLIEIEPGIWGRLPKKPKSVKQSTKAPKVSKTIVSDDLGAFLTTNERRYVFDVTPIGKPSFQKSDKWRTLDHSDPRRCQRPIVTKWLEFKKSLAILAKKQVFIMPASKSTILFILPMPDSWSKKKRALMDGSPHQAKPDADNLCKAFFDSICPDDDSYIWEYLVAKRWGSAGKIIITQ